MQCRQLEVEKQGHVYANIFCMPRRAWSWAFPSLPQPCATLQSSGCKPPLPPAAATFQSTRYDPWPLAPGNNWVSSTRPCTTGSWQNRRLARTHSADGRPHSWRTFWQALELRDHQAGRKGDGVPAAAPAPLIQEVGGPPAPSLVQVEKLVTSVTAGVVPTDEEEAPMRRRSVRPARSQHSEKRTLNEDYALQLKEEGNMLFKEGKLEEALAKYNEAFRSDPSMAEGPANAAAVYLKQGEWDRALQACNVALHLNPKYVKALRRRAGARRHLGQLHDAFNDLLRAKSLESLGLPV